MALLIKATCMGCDKWTNCGQVHDVGFVCQDCRGKFAPPPHIMRQIEQELDAEQFPQPERGPSGPDVGPESG